MSYRRLLTLIAGLGPNSLVLNIQLQRSTPNRARTPAGEEVIYIDDPKEIDRLFAGLARESQRSSRLGKNRKNQPTAPAVQA